MCICSVSSKNLSSQNFHQPLFSLFCSVEQDGEIPALIWNKLLPWLYFCIFTQNHWLKLGRKQWVKTKGIDTHRISACAHWGPTCFLSVIFFLYCWSLKNLWRTLICSFNSPIWELRIFMGHSLAILLSVCFTILMMLVQRICHWIN